MNHYVYKFCFVLQLTLPEDVGKMNSRVMVEDVFPATRDVTKFQTAQTDQTKLTVAGYLLTTQVYIRGVKNCGNILITFVIISFLGYTYLHVNTIQVNNCYGKNYNLIFIILTWRCLS